MPTKRGRDLQGRKYATVEGTKAGDVLITDGGFTCMPKGARRKVLARPDGSLYIKCSDNGHALDGQIHEDYYVGLYPAP